MFSATDVANFLSCHHLLTLDRAEAEGRRGKRVRDVPDRLDWLVARPRPTSWLHQCREIVRQKQEEALR